MELSPLRLRFLVVSLLTVSFIGALDNTVVSTSLATIAGDLGALQHLGWVIVGYTLASTVTLPIIGKLGDLFGPRTVFLSSLVVFLAASLACGLASSMAWLIVARVVQGMSSAGLQLMSQTIIARVTSPRERPRLMAIIGAAFPIAILVGPVLGGLITDYWGWPWIFWINLPIGVAAFALAVFAVPHIAAGARARFDFAGAATLTVALTALVLAVTWIGDPVLGMSATLAFVVSAIAFVAFFVVEFRVDEPLVPLRVFANRTVAAGTAISAIIGVGLFSITSYLPTYFQMTYGLSATASGLVPIATVFGMLVSNLLTGWLASRTGHYRPFPIVGTALGAGGLLVMSQLPSGAPLWVPMVVMAVVGVGTGAFMSLIVAVVQSAVSTSETGSITSTVNLVRQVGSTVATAVIGGVIGFGVAALLPVGLDASTLTAQLVQGSGPAVQAEVAAIYHDVFSPVFLALAITYGVGIVASILLPKGRLSADRVAEPERLAV
jgi:EmrB/QacA subfamily drug resistance transporter